MNRLVERMWRAVSPEEPGPWAIEGHGDLASRYDVTGLATASVVVAGLAARRGPVVVDTALTESWFRQAVHPVGWELPSPWDSLSDVYRTRDGWIRLHTNAPHHRLAALLVLGVTERAHPRTGARVVGAAVEPVADFAAERAAERADVEAAVAGWAGDELEAEIVEAGGAAAVLRTPGQWATHPQGASVAAEPLVHWEQTGAASGEPGFTVLDLTRVIAGPVATRFLAGLGAEVLRLDPPDWNEPAVEPDMTLGKRTARMNFADAGAMRKLGLLVAEADVIVHGYRADALPRLGLTPERLAELKPGIVEVALNAYGWSGPWRERRGFDSLVQMSSGIAYGSDGAPDPLPVQALDHATGYLAAAAALEGLHRRRTTGRGQVARVSLARTALELAPAPPAGRVARSAYRDLPSAGLDTPTASATRPAGASAGRVARSAYRDHSTAGLDTPTASPTRPAGDAASATRPAEASAGRVARSAYRDHSTAGLDTPTTSATRPAGDAAGLDTPTTSATRPAEASATRPAGPWHELDTPWGPARLLESPLTIGGEPLHWARGPRPLGDERLRFVP